MNSSGAARVRTRAGLEGAGTWGVCGSRQPGEPVGAAATDTNATTFSVSMMESVLEEDVTLPGTLGGCRCGPGFAGAR